MRDRICFYLNGQKIEAAGDAVFLTLSEFLRRRRGLTGTKVVCAEGDCGSCAVLIGRPDSLTIRYAAVTSCIQILFQMDALHVVTIEGLRDGQTLNPIQRAMVDCHGTQCGFCTPGFVVALQNHFNDPAPTDPARIRAALTGNLCRCTGYDSIVRAAMAVNREELKSIEELYPPDDMLSDLNTLAGQEVLSETASRRFYKPVTVEQAVRFRQANVGCGVIAGATDLGVVYNKRLRSVDVAMSLSAIQSLRQIRIEPGALQLGAGVTLAQLESLAHEHLPELGEFMKRFGSQLIRSAGTLVGNLVTASPIGDTIPALLVLDAEVELTGVAGSRTTRLCNFLTGYRKTALADDELVTAVRIPLLGEGQTLRLYKVSRRRDLDISSFSAAIWMRRSNGLIEDIRLAFGGVGSMVMRLPRAEAVLRGRPPTRELFEQAGKVARMEITPISDVRGSEIFRRVLAENIILRFWHEVLA